MNTKGTFKGYRCIIHIFIFVIGVAGNAIAQNDAQYFNPGENLVEKTGKYLFIKVVTNKKQAYVGECIVAEYRLYVASEIEGKLARSPSFAGFAGYDMLSDNSNNYDVENIGGIPFRIYQIRKIQLYGLTAGKHRLLPVELDATVRYINLDRKENAVLESVYAKEKDTTIQYVAKSPSIDLQIIPLPKGDEKTFAVGDFEISSSLSSGTVGLGMADTLFLTLQGAGNWHDVSGPEIDWPEGLEIFEPTVVEDLVTTQAPLRGSKTFAYPIVAARQGTYKLPAVRFSFFHPVKKKYITLQTNALAIKVTPNNNDKDSNAGMKRPSFTGIFSRYAIILFPLAALGLVVVVIFSSRKNKKQKLE